MTGVEIAVAIPFFGAIAYVVLAFVFGIWSDFHAPYGTESVFFNWPVLFMPKRKYNKAFTEGYNDMKRSGSLSNPFRGRIDDFYMDHDNEKMFNAYIKGGDKRLDELFADKAGTSKRKLRESMLESNDKARLESVKAIEEIQTNWQDEYDKLQAQATPVRRGIVGRKKKNVWSA